MSYTRTANPNLGTTGWAPNTKGLPATSTGKRRYHPTRDHMSPFQKARAADRSMTKTVFRAGGYAAAQKAKMAREAARIKALGTD